jgi:hypothetical protein
MSNDTTDTWRDYIVYGYGFFRARVPAQALAADLVTVIGDATIEITAETGVDDPGVTVQITPDDGADFDEVWFEVDPAAHEEVNAAGEYADAIAAAAAASGPTEVQLHGWSGYAMPDLVPVLVEVATDPDTLDGVYLDIATRFDADDAGERRVPVLTSQQAAADTAEAIHAAVAYLTQVTEDPDTSIEGGADLHGDPVDLDVVVALRRDPQITLFRWPAQGLTRMAVLTVEQCRDLHDALTNAATTSGYVKTTLTAADEDGDPLDLAFETSPGENDWLTFGAADQHPEPVWLDTDTTAELRDALHGALAFVCDHTGAGAHQ